MSDAGDGRVVEVVSASLAQVEVAGSSAGARRGTGVAVRPGELVVWHALFGGQASERRVVVRRGGRSWAGTLVAIDSRRGLLTVVLEGALRAAALRLSRTLGVGERVLVVSMADGRHGWTRGQVIAKRPQQPHRPYERSFLIGCEVERPHAPGTAVVFDTRGRLVGLVADADPPDVVVVLPAEWLATTTFVGAPDPEVCEARAIAAYEGSGEGIGSAVLCEAGLAYEHAGRADQALRAFSAAARLEPDNPWVHRKLGWALASLGRQEEAVAAFARSDACEPEAGEGSAF